MFSTGLFASCRSVFEPVGAREGSEDEEGFETEVIILTKCRSSDDEHEHDQTGQMLVGGGDVCIPL